ncbi:MAG: mechanosensitive ion channel domain-containing protein [Planctomycetota bacterium]
MQTEFNKARQREDLAKLPTSVGAMLRKQRMELPNLRAERAELREREDDIVTTHLNIIKVDEERGHLADLDKRAEQLIVEDPTNTTADPVLFELLKEDTKELLEERLEILEPLQQAQRQLFDVLTETTVDQDQLIKETEEFHAYIDQRVLWIQSALPLNIDLRFDELVLWASADTWIGILDSLREDFKKHWPAYAAALCIFLVLTLASLRAGHVLSDLAEQSRRSTCRQFLPTARALFITVVLAARNMLPLAFFAWRLPTASADPNALQLATTLTFVLAVVTPLEFFRQVARRDGLADAHFDWSERTVTLLRTLLGWLVPLAATTVLVGSLLSSEDGSEGTTIERLLFIVCALLVCRFLFMFMHPTRGLPASHLREYPDGWIARLQPLWFSILVVAPVGFAVLSAAGYVYTAHELAWRAYCTIIVLSAITTLFALIARALLVNRRAAYIDQARQRYQAAEVEAARAAGDPPTSEGSPDVLLAEVVQSQDPLADIRSQTLQARRLMRALLMAASILAVWFTWSDVLPALDFMERWAPWQSTATVVEFDELNGETVQRTVVDPVTYVDILIAAIVVVLSLVAARDIPGMAEIMVLNHLPLEKSVKYAITTLISYAIILAGLIISCKYVGLRWSQIQWMATALTFGLAFGLQEMFANFIAGIIILFERPIRVGDIVTLADVTGVVSRVQIRATTITNWDRKDYIVPNKDFITGRVLNWTLSDHVNRIVVNIGVAYGSDTRLAKQLITGIARKHPVVVDDPEPIVTFEGFGDSSLTFVLRSYISMKDMPMRLTVIDELHTQIDDEFRKAGIEIAFPQQDLHIRSMPEEFFKPDPEAKRTS